MRLQSLIPSVLLAGFIAESQPIKLSGKVLKAGPAPLPNAIVTLVGMGKKDTTDAQGAFLFEGAFSAVRPGNTRLRNTDIFLHQNEVRFQVTEATRLSVEVFAGNGERLATRTVPFAPAGAYRLDLTGMAQGTQIHWVRASQGNQARYFRYVPAFGKGGSRNAAFEPVGTPLKALAKKAADVDTLQVEAAGYVTKRVGVAAYDAVVDITLERVTTDLAEFSFFITSQEGLYKLAKTFSGSDKGFGGDFRYGMTGPGAGLKGADKICGDLAESSMPGAKAKGWRAFLSAVADENGKQVNAIDRIGEGPWYDRLGRLVSKDKTGLLATRPAGDAEIMDDLPNEFGVPNHRPDPTLPEVDNHLTVTGTNNLGQLYGPDATCEDWTSTTKRPGPRVGMAWPQAGGFPLKNWISEWDQTGCEAGFDVDPKTGAGNRNDYSVGKGGGYGGYYCFALTP
jgi:hypothetical protein